MQGRLSGLLVREKQILSNRPNGGLSGGRLEKRDLILIGKSLIDFEMKIDPRFFRKRF
jgi:hypothetical protein